MLDPALCLYVLEYLAGQNIDPVKIEISHLFYYAASVDEALSKALQILAKLTPTHRRDLAKKKKIALSQAADVTQVAYVNKVRRNISVSEDSF